MCIVCKINITRGKKKGFVDFSKKGFRQAIFCGEMKYIWTNIVFLFARM